FDYVQKPFEIEEMEVKIEKALEVKRLKNEIEYLRDAQQDRYDFEKIIGTSPALQRVLDIVKKVAKSNTTVLVRGETGTGKELIRRFEQADGGTLFLDEIGDMSASTQAKILRVLQEHEFERLGGTRTLRVDVRLIAATNRDLPQMVAAGQFREDLYYRLNVVSIEMPPLRERKDDIVPLANTFIRKFSAELKKKIDGIEPDAQKLLMRYNWPGNIRELENTI